MNEEQAREIAIQILDEFEKLLAAKGIRVPSEDRERRDEEACLYGREYYELENGVTGILVEEVGLKSALPAFHVVRTAIFSSEIFGQTSYFDESLGPPRSCYQGTGAEGHIPGPRMTAFSNNRVLPSK